jgi:hypothetical protein
VIGERLRDDQQRGLRDLGDVGVAEGGAILGDHGGPVGLARVVDEESAVERVVGVKRESEQALLSSREHLGRDVEEDGGGRRLRQQDLDPACLLDHEEPIASVMRMGRIERTAEVCEHGLELQGYEGLARRGQRRSAGRGGRALDGQCRDRRCGGVDGDWRRGPGATFQEDAHELGVPTRGRHRERRITLGRLRVDGGTMIEQQNGNVVAAAIGGDDQARAPEFVPGVR